MSIVKKNIADMTEVEFATFFQVFQQKAVEDPLNNFVRARGFIDFEPSPGQTVLLKCIFGQELDGIKKHQVYVETTNEEEYDLQFADFTEIDLYEFFTGLKYEYSAKKYNKINLLCGRRSGKSTNASIISLYSAIKINWKPFLKKTPVATIAVLSNNLDLSQEILDIIRQMVENSPILSRLQDKGRKNTQSTFHLKIPFLQPDGQIEYSCVAIKVGAASKKTTRGRAVCTLLADEACWWNLDENSKESDVDVFRAIRPALMQFGEHATTIKLSSPAIKAGVMYDEWNRREELKDDFIQLKAPSWMMNSFLPKEEFLKEFRLDPDGYNTEFRANFVDSISNFIIPEFVDMCVMKGVTFLPPSDSKNTVYTAAIDAAFKKDRFAFALVGHEENRIRNYVLKYWEGSKANPVKAHDVAKFIRTICIEYGVSVIHADQHSFQPLKEIFEEYGMRLEESVFSLPFKRKIYFGMKRLVHSQQIDLLDIPLLHQELKQLQVEQTPTGQIRIGHPSSGSDDCSDALAVATFRALEKAGTGNMALNSNFASYEHSKVKIDSFGRAFSAPTIEMLHNYQGFGDVEDNSEDWVKHPETGKWIQKWVLEQEEGVIPSEGADFIF